MGVAFFRGQQLGRNDLNIFLLGVEGTPVDAAEISYALYDFTLGYEVLVGAPHRVPGHPSLGEYFASLFVPLDANLGKYRIRWTFLEAFGDPLQQSVMEFEIVDKTASGLITAPVFTGAMSDLIRRMRIMLRDSNPDRNYHFRPPAHEETVQQYSRVFGFIWEDQELGEFLERALDMIGAAPPRTVFQTVDQLVQQRPEWRTLLLTGATVWAIGAMRLNWIADEFSVSPDTAITVGLPDGRRISLPIAELHAILYEECSGSSGGSHPVCSLCSGFYYGHIFQAACSPRGGFDTGGSVRYGTRVSYRFLPSG